MSRFKFLSKNYRRYVPYQKWYYRPTNELTLSTWVYPNNSTLDQHIIGTLSMGYRIYLKSINSYSYIACDLGIKTLYHHEPVKDRTWYHVAMTWDGSELILYINGQISTSLLVNKICYNDNVYGDNIWCFEEYFGGNSFLCGQCLWTLWAICLNSDNIANLANNGNPSLIQTYNIILGDTMTRPSGRLFGDLQPLEIINDGITVTNIDPFPGIDTMYIPPFDITTSSTSTSTSSSETSNTSHSTTSTSISSASTSSTSSEQSKSSSSDNSSSSSSDISSSSSSSKSSSDSSSSSNTSISLSSSSSIQSSSSSSDSTIYKSSFSSSSSSISSTSTSETTSTSSGTIYGCGDIQYTVLGYSYRKHELGTDAGVVRFEYNMLGVSDTVEIYYDDVLIKTIGPHTYEGDDSFYYDPNPGGPYLVVAKFITPSEKRYKMHCPVDPYPCGSAEYNFTGQAVRYHDLGVENGNVIINYDMYTIADSLDVYYNGVLVASTYDPVLGSGSLNFYYDPDPGIYYIELKFYTESRKKYQVLCPVGSSESSEISSSSSS